MCIVRFDGIDQHFHAPDVYSNIKLAQSIKISTVGDVRSILTNRGHLSISATILPTDAFLQTPNWKLLDNEVIGATTINGSTSSMLYATGLATGNGHIRVVAYVNDGSKVADTIRVFMNMQGGVDSTKTAVAMINSNSFEMYPVPANDFLKLKFQEDLTGTASIINLNGSVMSIQAIKSKEIKLDVRNLNKGVYLLKLDIGSELKIMKFVKQ